MKIDSNLWELGSTGFGAPYQGAQCARKYAVYVHGVSSSVTVQMQTAQSTDGPWVAAITLSTASVNIQANANSANYRHYEGPLLAIRPHLVNLAVSTGSARIQLVSVD
jgi:hypothetical protein